MNGMIKSFHFSFFLVIISSIYSLFISYTVLKLSSSTPSKFEVSFDVFCVFAQNIVPHQQQQRQHPSLVLFLFLLFFPTLCHLFAHHTVSVSLFVWLFLLFDTYRPWCLPFLLFLPIARFTSFSFQFFLVVPLTSTHMMSLSGNSWENKVTWGKHWKYIESSSSWKKVKK